MRLLILTQYFWPENFRVNDLAAEMTRRGHVVTVLTGRPNYPEGAVFPEFRRNPEGFARYEGVEIIRFPMVARGTGKIRLVINYLSFVVGGVTAGAWRLRGRQFDAIFVFQPSPITSCLPAIFVGWLKSAPVLLWVLDLWPESLEAIGVVRAPWLLGLVGRLVSFIYRHCDLVLAQSRAFVESIGTYSRDASRIRYFPGWSEALFEGGLDQVSIAPELETHRGSFNVLFAGNVGEAQDFPAILDAAEALRDRRDIRWLIVGDGRAAPWVVAEIERRSLGATVRMLGRHPIERMPSFFRGADALLVTLKRHPVFARTIPGKVQTYLASGLPLLAMLDGEGARVIEQSGAGFVVPAGDGAALAAGVIRMASLSPAERASMGSRAVEYSEREFGRDRLLTQLESWMSQLKMGSPIAETT